MLHFFKTFLMHLLMEVCNIRAENCVAHLLCIVAPEKLRVWRTARGVAQEVPWWWCGRSGTQGGDPGPVCNQHLRLHHGHVLLLLRYPTHTSSLLELVISRRNSFNHRNGNSIPRRRWWLKRWLSLTLNRISVYLVPSNAWTKRNARGVTMYKTAKLGQLSVGIEQRG